MLRFVDVRGYGTDGRFSYYNTVTGKYLELDGDQIWDSMQEVEESHTSDRSGAGLEYPLDRLQTITPQWAFIQSTEEEMQEAIYRFYGVGAVVGQRP